MSWGHSATPLPRNWPVIRHRVLRGSDVCWLCHRPGADEVDHITPRFRGGSDELDNLRPVHRSCHASKSSAEGHARKRELKARKSRPAERHPGSL